MKWKKVVPEFLVVFAVAFVTTAVVNFIFSLITHRQEGVDFQSAVRFGILFAVLITWVHNRKNNN